MDAWLLTSVALLVLMTFGLSLFYGGLSNAGSIINMSVMTIASIAIVTISWVFLGYSLVFSGSGPLVGNFNNIGLKDVDVENYTFVAFQMMFAVIATVLISGAVAGRAKFQSWLLFAILWSLFVYVPVAHWVWSEDGFLNSLGALDFAGGTVVHIAAGASALALAFVLGRPKVDVKAHNIPLVVLGAGLIFTGWIGFNAGSALEPGTDASRAVLTTLVAAAGGAVGWFAIEAMRSRSITSVGASSGLIAGLVGVTPAAAFITVGGALIIGLAAGAAAAWATVVFKRIGFFDTLDVVAVHLIAGFVGTVLLGALAIDEAGVSLVGKQAIAAVVAAVFAFSVSFLIGLVIKALIGFRVSEELEASGIDVQHRESAYTL